MVKVRAKVRSSDIRQHNVRLILPIQRSGLVLRYIKAYRFPCTGLTYFPEGTSSAVVGDDDVAAIR